MEAHFQMTFLFKVRLPAVSDTGTVKVYHCANGDRPLDRQVRFRTHSVCQCTFDGEWSFTLTKGWHGHYLSNCCQNFIPKINANHTIDHTVFSIDINDLLFMVSPLCATVVMVTRWRHFVVYTVGRLGHRCCRCCCRRLCRHGLRLTRSGRWTGFTTRQDW